MNLERNRDEQKLPENPPENRKKNVTLGEALVAATKDEMGHRGGGSRGGGAWPDSDPRALVKEEGRGLE